MRQLLNWYRQKMISSYLIFSLLACQENPIVRVFGQFRALKILCHTTMNSKVEYPPSSVFSFNKIGYKPSCKKQFYTWRQSSSVTENMQGLQELFFILSRWTTLELKFSLYMMESTGISPWCASIRFHCHLGGGILLAEQHSTLKWQVAR